MTSLFDDVDLLSLDAGNTVIFLDHARLAQIAVDAGFPVSRDRLIVTEGEAKRLLGHPSSAMRDPAWKDRSLPGAAGWGRTVATMLALAGVPDVALADVVSRAWVRHVEHNLWSLVPEGFEAAMANVRAAGVKIAIVSNSEGMLDRLFRELGIFYCFDAIVDSGKVGVEKPDPRIFRIACEQTGTTEARGLHLGDTFATDVLGAQAAGMRTALIDPYAHYEGLYPEVPRVLGVVEAAREILSAVRGRAG